MIQISDEDVLDAVAEAKDEIYRPGEPIDDADRLLSVVSAIATKATLRLLGINVGENGIDKPATMPFPLVFAEWAQQFTLKTHFDRVLAVMLYLRQKDNVQAVSTSDIARMYDKARWKKPANMADVFAKGADRILFTEAEDQVSEDGLKMWQMTQTGYQYLMDLQREV